ncbi:MAG: thiamine phosphate synthase [Acidiferrobacterales bacterium]|jgi:thiamine-phosphate pyrophosphorylase
MASETVVAGLYAIADAGLLDTPALAAAVEHAIRGGASLIQYRDKAGNPASRENQARTLARVCENHKVALIINDDPALAARVGAAGVHLGRDDADPGKARSILGPGAIIGVSCYNDLECALVAEAQSADYVAFGSFYPSPTKPTAVQAPLALLRAARSRLRVPIVAIGGITPENGGALIAAGADALAVIHGVFKQPDIEHAARRYAALFPPRSNGSGPD